MSTIANKLQRILDTKEDIRQALIEEGKDVPADMPFRLYPEVVRNNKLEGLIGMYTGKGYTNESMSKNPVWYDTSGNGNHIALKNFGWELNSGCGIYLFNFKYWGKNTAATIEEISVSKIHINTKDGGGGIYNSYKPDNNVLKVNVDLVGELDFRWYNGVKWSVFQKLIKGINVIDLSKLPEDTISISFYLHLNSSAIIEQIPDYDGAICFDGVDDFGICETFPVLTKEKGYTVMALRNWITRDKNFEGLISGVKRWNANGAFLLEYKNNASSLAVSFGKATVINIPSSILTYQTTTEYNGTRLLVGEYAGEDVLLVGRSAIEGFQFYSNFALYAFAIFDHDTTAEERQPVIDYWKKEFPELFPDEAWTVTGKSNSDADRAVIKNITGNGNDLVLTNFAFSGKSGYGSYVYNWHGWGMNPGNIITQMDRYDNRFVIAAPAVQSVISGNIYSPEYPIGTEFKFGIKITGLTSGWHVRVMQGPGGIGNIVQDINKDGVYQIDHILTDAAEQPRLYIRINSDASGAEAMNNLVIEQIPDYEGYLVTDGVDDQVTSSGFTLSEKYTIVGDWELMTSTPSNSGICKDSQFYVYNTESGIVLYLNSTNKGNPMPIKQLKAICSDGRCYDKNWNEIMASPGDISGSSLAIRIGYFSNSFTQVAFKNLAIYKDKVFTKEQCIQAYNHLQTLKAK